MVANPFNVDMSESEGRNVDMQKQITMIKNFIYDFDMDLQGHEWNGSIGKYDYTGVCLTDSETRNKIISLLKPFTSDINLITDLTVKEFSAMKYRTNSLLNEYLTTNFLGVPTENKRLVMNKFMNTLKLIGGIILGSKKDMFNMLNGYERSNDGGLRID